jgi:organic hydroperoxide reductase OsmC/OhrA
MAEYTAIVTWARKDDPFLAQRYSREHRWVFDGGVEVPASASPHVVRAPWSQTAAVDPEEALVASISSCHMLFFLSLASKAGFVVERYEDHAVGSMGKNAAGKEAMLSVTLRPVIGFSGEKRPSEEELEHLHHQAHERCYIANSVNFPVTVGSRQ